MSGRFRRFNYRSRARYARGRYSGRRVGAARRARGNARAANQQSDISNVTINLMKKVKAGVTGKYINGSKKEIGTCALNIFELLRRSEFYQSYSNMYDQFRVNRIQVKITPVTWRTYDQFNLPAYVTGDSAGSAIYPSEKDDTTNPPTVKDLYGPPSEGGIPKVSTKYIVPQALTIVTAWDRTGLDDTQVAAVTEEGKTFIYTTIGDALTTYSSAKSTQLVAGANFNCVRYLYPSSQQEKSLYFSTNDLVQQYLDPDASTQWYQMRPAENYSNTYITNLHSDPNCPFKPTFLISVLKVDELDVEDISKGDPDAYTGQIYPVTFNLEFDIGVTFRGLRRTQVV